MRMGALGSLCLSHVPIFFVTPQQRPGAGQSLPLKACSEQTAHHLSVLCLLYPTWTSQPEFCAGRCSTEITYDVGFDMDGKITGLRIEGAMLAGAVQDLAGDDPSLLKTGAGTVSLQMSAPMSFGIGNAAATSNIKYKSSSPA